jgi:hypothetical protein
MVKHTTKGIFMVAAAVAMLFVACEKEQLTGEKISLSGENMSLSTFSSISTSPYKVVLENKISNVDGTFTWTWSVQNTNPGNGKIGSGTVQDLSHWGVTLGTCATMADVVSGATSADGIVWTAFTPSLQIDKSQACYANSVVKFDIGTVGNQKSYYKLTISKDLETDATVTALFKSGKNTGCGTFLFPGFGCPKPVKSCSLSQGYWFASPVSAQSGTAIKKWSSSGVTVGGHTYSEAEGRAIWGTSNQGGIPDSKSGFHQVAAIKLSGSTVSPSASVWADVAIVEGWLSGLGKLSTSNLPTGNTAAKAAAGRIGDWINANHCD